LVALEKPVEPLPREHAYPPRSIPKKRARGAATITVMQRPADVDFTEAVLSLFDPDSSDVRADPWPLCRSLREQDPVYETPTGGFVLTEYETSQGVLRDPRFSVDPRNMSETPVLTDGSVGLAGRGLDQMMLFVDPPDHTRLRSLVAKAFTPRVINLMQSRIDELVNGLLDRMDAAGEADLVGEYAYPIPVAVICEILGIPEEDRSSFKEWAWDIAPVIDPFVSAADMEKIVVAGMGLVDYFNQLIQQRSKEKGEDLLSQLIEVQEAGERLTREELVSTCLLLLLAGFETTMNLIGNGLFALIEARTELDRLRSDPTLVVSAVEELLRHDGPALLTARIALERVRVGDKEVEPGRLCVIVIGAANRDPGIFQDPDRLDIAREPNKHLAFSAGPHFCLGATLARMEARAAVNGFVQRFRDIELASPPQWRRTVTFRGLDSLRVRLSS